MTPRVRIETYARRVSVPLALAWKLWDKCGLLRLKQENSEWRSRSGDLIINWGCSSSRHTTTPGIKFLNHPNFVHTKQSKLRQYSSFHAAGVPTLEYTRDPIVAYGWVHDDKEKVYCRVKDSGFGGRGIEVINPEVEVPIDPDDMPNAAVYTKEFNALREYRVHVFPNAQGVPVVIDVTQKRRRNGQQKSDVRSWGNGYVFCHDKVKPLPESAKQACINAVKALGLDFGGVDILVKKDGTCAVLEVNSAPGIEGTTLDRYAEAINAYANSVRNAG
jgi:hypothetical protein